MNFSWKSCFMRYYGLIREHFMESCFMRYFKLFSEKNLKMFFMDFFVLKKKVFFWKKYMPTQNFPKIPKIALRKPCDHYSNPMEGETWNSAQDDFLLGGSSYEAGYRYKYLRGGVRNILCTSLHTKNFYYFLLILNVSVWYRDDVEKN